jgi:transcriptional regulator with GAF, ATPase, and Fis domain
MTSRYPPRHAEPASHGATPGSGLAVEERLPFEEFLADIAARFVNVPEDLVDEAIQESLEGLTRTLGVDRCGLVQIANGGRSLMWSHGFAMQGIPAWEELDFAVLLPWYTQQILEGRTQAYGRLPGDLPAEAGAEREWVTRVGLKSNLTLPLKVGRDVLGAVGVGSFRAYRDWDATLVTRLEVLASVFANALHRRRSAELLLRANAELERSLQEIRELKDRLEAENVYLQKEVRHSLGFQEIVGTSAALARVLDMVKQVATADSPVLLLGETGTGKDRVARAIHERSRRRERPLITVNCAALPVTLIESELFGYEKGAFTGALARALGRFEVADGGSILLDEVGELPLEVQAKLLRVLEKGEFERLGSAKTVKVDARVIAATNRDLEREVREGRFRPDLYYRLSVFPISLPPLRERREDIPLLVWHFIGRKQGTLGKTIERVPDRLMRAFEAYAWPGNVRELENVIERALILTKGDTLVSLAPFVDSAGALSPTATASRLDDVERAHILQVLGECRWRVAGRGNAAERLGLKRGTLQARMQKLGIRRPGAEK